MITSTLQDCISSLITAIKAAGRSEEPYRHWIVADCFPDDVRAAMLNMPFPVPELGGESGRREIHNKTRNYFDAENYDQHKVCQLVSDAFQSAEVVTTIQESFDLDLTGTFLRLEYAQDGDGFWLEPHTDLGVKKYTMLLYLSDDAGHENLGTDIYVDANTHHSAPAFTSNSALVFVPADNTWHGFELREIPGVRKSLIINYVTSDWRAKEQLVFADRVVA